MSSWQGKTRGGVSGYRIFVWILKHLGLSFAYFLLYFVVTYFIFASGKAITHTYSYFRHRLKWSVLRTIAGIWRNYFVFGQVILDKIAMLAGFQYKFSFDFEGEEYLRQMNQGGLLISAHMGNWEIAGHLLNRLEKTIHIILYDAEHQQIRRYLSDVLTTRRVNFIIIREDYSHLQQIRDAFSKGDIIAMHGDRFIEGNKVMMIDFLGQPAPIPTGPISLAARFNVPVSFVFAMKETRKHYHFYATPLRMVEFSNNLKKREAILREALGAYVKEMEKMTVRYPHQWFNYYDFWKVHENRENPATGHPKKKRKFLLVSANRFDNPYPVYPIGISYIYSYLTERLPHFDIRIFDFNLHTSEEFALYVKSFQPDYTGISLRNVDDVNSWKREWFIDDYKEIITLLKNSITTRIIIGGSAFSIFPKELFELFEPDFGIRGEGEESLFRLLTSLDSNTSYSDIPGLVHRVNGEVIMNRKNDFLNKLDLSFENSLLGFYWKKSGMMNVQTKRGCPYNCIYCTYPLIEGTKVRMLDPDSIIETLSDLYFNQNIDYVFFTDSVFNLGTGFNTDLAQRMIKAKLKISWGAYFSPCKLTEDELRLYQQAGLTHIEFGTESLSDTTLKNYGKHFTVDEVIRISEICNRLGIYYAHFLILGGYGETESTLEEGFENSKRIHDSVFFPYIGMRIYPGTRLQELAIREGYISPDDNLLEPVYYIASGIRYDLLKEKAEKTGKRWVFPDEDVVTSMNRMRERNRKGSLWHHLKK